MTARERWYNVFHYLPVDHVPDIEFGYWGETLPVWHEQGMPEEISTHELADRYFGFEHTAGVPVRNDLLPAFETKVLEDSETRQVVVDGSGVTCLIRKDGSSIPHFIDWSLKTPADWEEFKARLNPDDPARYPENLEQLTAELNASDLPVGVSCGSLFGRLRDWMGFENIAIACMDQPEWVEQMITDMTDFFLATLDRVLKGVRVDMGFFWEDMAFKQGPMISPKLFAQWLTPNYKRITDFVRQRAGAEVFVVDCDGNINVVVEHWLAGGVNCMFPLEVAAGTVPEVLRERFGREVLLQGGVNKRELAKDKEAVRREVERVAKLVEQGGYVPHVDHRVPPDVPYDNYVYYLKLKREKLGIPDPWAEGPPDPQEIVEQWGQR